MSDHTLMDALQMTVKQQTKELIIVEMPISGSVKQPMGYLHGGGATVALAETAASIGGLQHVDPIFQNIVGIEINCNHLQAKKDGTITAQATPIHIGKKTMVWNINIVDENNQLIAISRCTLGIVDKKKH
ncbi:ComA operon protein 2 [Gracilibacillus boraciitolerans JCM 21714]|uniref:ComA operon protein 2 n=1 Tax=Gracilibacillus boraciitolerans JCM 21714 TaxID=1298598 RepID=W4VMP4_9BACI|nr:hotdog fold thioesterase [Gracilibacillus boraciitolerans]GAE94019.1 ComA operon protein 2 [Gracilibacillus boraciitolerans JCM 21714]